MKTLLANKAVRLALLAGGYLLLALLLTWPLAANLTRAIPAGSEPPTVSLHQLYLMEHNRIHLDGQGPYWDAAFFHPHLGTFAWSEPQPLTGAMFWLLRKMGAGPALAYNLLVLLFLVASGVLAFLLARQLTDHRPAAILSGAWVCCGAYMLHQLCVLHLLAVALPAWFLLSLIELRRRFRIGPLIGLGLSYVATWLTCAQFGMFLTLLLPVAFLGLFSLRTLDWKKWLRLAGSGLAAGLALLPLLLAQHSRLDAMGLERSMSDVLGNFHLHDLLLPAKGHWLTGRLLGFDDQVDIYSWDPGLTLLAVLLAGLGLGMWRAARSDPERYPVFRAHFWLLAVAVLLGFGPRLGVWIEGENYGPYSLLAALVPGLDGVRSPARLAAFVTLSLSVLSAGALGHLRRRLTRRWELGLLIGLAVLLLAEAWTVPVRLAATGELSDGYRQATRWLAEQDDGGVVLELPLPTGTRPVDLEGEVRAMRRMQVHRHPIVNGYSAHFPEPFWQLTRALRHDPAGRGVRFLRALEVRYVMADLNRIRIGKLLESLSHKVHVFPDSIAVFELLPAQAIPAIDFPTESKLRMSPQEGNMLRIRLNQPVSQAALLMAGEDRILSVKWQGQSGDWESVGLSVHGSVLLDQQQSVVYLLIGDLPLLGGTGRARLISQAEVNRRTPGSFVRSPSRPPDADR